MDWNVERLWTLFIPLLLTTCCTCHDKRSVGWLISHHNYGTEEARCFQAAAEIAYAEIESNGWNFWLTSKPEQSRIAVDQKSTLSELDNFQQLFSSGVKKFIGPSMLGQAEIFRELRSNASAYDGVEFYAPFPLKEFDQDMEKFIKRAVPSWERHHLTLLLKFRQYLSQTPDGVNFSIMPVIGGYCKHKTALNSSWQGLLDQAEINGHFRVLPQLYCTAESPNDFMDALREAMDLGSHLHIVVLDSEIVPIINMLAAHSRPQMRKSSIHIHSVAAMNYQEDVAALLEVEDNIVLHTVEHVGHDWHSTSRRQFYRKLRRKISEKAYGHVHCPPATSAVYDGFIVATGGQAIDSSLPLQDDNATVHLTIVQAFYQPESLIKKTEPLIRALQESHWIWDGPVNLLSTANVSVLSQIQLSNEPSAEIITKPIIKAIFRSKLGRDCLDTEVIFNSYDPWQFSLVEKAYTVIGLPFIVMVANIWGFWIDFKCYKKTSVSIYTLACGQKSLISSRVQQDAENVTVTVGGFSHCTDKFFVEDLQSSTKAVRSEVGWSSQQAKLLWEVKDLLSTATADRSLIRTKRQDLYSASWLYEILHRQPGQIAPLLAEIAPNIMSCFGVLLGCMNCVMIRNVFDRSGIGCMVPCASNQGHACGNAWGNFLSTHLKARSVICTELFKQGHIDVETFLADASFGATLEQKDPTVLEGYRLLAAPAVKAAQKSPTFSLVLKYGAHPWMSYMKFEEGLSEKQSMASIAGRVIIMIAKPLLRLTAAIHSYSAYYQFLSLF